MASKVGVRVEGFERWRTQMFQLKAAAKEETDWWIGTIVSYAGYVEFGTRFMRARPYVQPAIFRVARKFKSEGAKAVSLGSEAGSSRVHGRQLWGILVGDDEGIARRIAFSLEREMKQIIKEKGAIDTGNLRASIVAAQGLSEMKAGSFGKATNKRAVSFE